MAGAILRSLGASTGTRSISICVILFTLLVAVLLYATGSASPTLSRDDVVHAFRPEQKPVAVAHHLDLDGPPVINQEPPTWTFDPKRDARLSLIHI